MRDDEEKLTNRPGPVTVTPADLTPLGIGTLRDYIAALQAEIARAEAAISQKDAARGLADSFFRKPA